MLERTTGIEPASSAWEADILPMNYVRACICLASVLPMPAACPLKCHALKRCTFWRETCLASAIALRLVNQRARAASRLRSDICLASALRSLSLRNRSAKNIIRQVHSQLAVKRHALKRCVSGMRPAPLLPSPYGSSISGLGLQSR